MDAAEEAMAQLTDVNGGFQRWLAASTSSELLDSWNETMLQSVFESEESYHACCRDHFSTYEPAPDVAGWLVGLAVLAETLPLSFTVSDATIAGFPLIFVNRKFVETTGYDKSECAMRNCRFLQGPATDPEHGQHLVDTLREGQDSQTLLLNYRKSGDPFENLLTMRFVGDSLGRRRFCVGLQLDFTGMESDPGPWGAHALRTEAGHELLKQSRSKMSKLIQMLPGEIPVRPVPPSRPFSASTSWSCPKLAALADALGFEMPRTTRGVGWTTTLCALLERSPHPAILVDMKVPSLPITYANEAFAKLTGYPVEEAVGRNCRFLQGPPTESTALATLVTAIREHTQTDVSITNVRKDGSAFLNQMSLNPIFDSTGMYRYNIGLLSEAGAEEPKGIPLDVFRQNLPTEFNASLQPMPSLAVVPHDPIQQWKEFQPMTSKLMRMLWATDADGALRQLLMLPPWLREPAIASLHAFLLEKSPQEAEKLSMLVDLMNQGSWKVMAGKVDQPGA